MIELTDKLGLRDAVHSIHPMLMSTRHHPIVQATTDWLFGIVIERMEPTSYAVTMWWSLIFFILALGAVLAFIIWAWYGALWWIMLACMGLGSFYILDFPPVLIDDTCRFLMLVGLYFFSIFVGFFRMDSEFWYDTL